MPHAVLTPSAPPSRLTVGSRPWRTRLGARAQGEATYLTVNADEEEARCALLASEGRERNRIDVLYLKSQQLVLFAVPDSEAAGRDDVVRAEARERALLHSSERVARRSASDRGTKRLSHAATVLIEEARVAFARVVADAQSENEGLYHLFLIHRPPGWRAAKSLRPSMATYPGKRQARSPPRTAGHTIAESQCSPIPPRPPTTFPDDRTVGRRIYERDKAVHRGFQQARDRIDACELAELRERREVLGEEAAAFMGVEREAIDKSIAARDAQRTREGREAAARAKYEAEKHLHVSATKIQKVARGRRSRVRANAKRQRIEGIRKAEEQRDQAAVLLQASGRGLQSRWAAAKARVKYEAERRAAEAAGAARQSQEASSVIDDVLSSALSTVAQVANASDLPALRLLLNVQASTEWPVLFAIARSWSLNQFPAVQALFVAHVRGQQAALSPSGATTEVPDNGADGEQPPKPYLVYGCGAILDGVARCMQPPTRTGRCGTGLLAALYIACERCGSSTRLPYSERILGMNGVAAPVAKPAKVHGTTMFGQHAGLRMLMEVGEGTAEDNATDAEKQREQDDEALSLLSLKYLHHASWSAANGLFHGRIDEPLSPSRWRPYTSLAELFEEERSAEMQREDCDRFDLERLERNTRFDIERLDRILRGLEAPYITTA
jgi:hypothetical protein